MAGRRIPFTKPMECEACNRLPEGGDWQYEVKLDGYRAQIIREGPRVWIFSRNGIDLTRQFPEIAEEAQGLPAGCAIDGEICALTPDGVPSFQLLQNRANRTAPVVFYAFDLLYLEYTQLLGKPLAQRRAELKAIIPDCIPIKFSEGFQVPLARMLDIAREHGLEGVVAKRLSSTYHVGKRDGAWQKIRITMGQEFVIGGYTPGDHGIDALVIGFYRDGKLIYCGRVRNGFVPASRRQVHGEIKHLRTDVCPFANLPEKTAGRWGQGLTAAKIKECVWLRPERVAQIEFLEWTDGDHLRHVKFIGLRNDKPARDVVRET